MQNDIAADGRTAGLSGVELAYVFASQGHRDQAFTVLGQSGQTNPNDDLLYRAEVEALLGEQERAMDLLYELGSSKMKELHGRGLFWLLREYPPFQEFTRQTD